MPLIKLYRRTENLWFSISRKIRFLLVGGFNTLFSYLLFVLLVQYASLPYAWALLIQYAVTINVSIFTMRYYVFRSSGNLLREYTKAWGVYLGMLASNYVALFLMIDTAGLSPVAAQTVYTAVATVLMYIIHQKITFRKTKAPR